MWLISESDFISALNISAAVFHPKFNENLALIKETGKISYLLPNYQIII
jgi:hypothetical protein